MLNITKIIAKNIKTGIISKLILTLSVFITLPIILQSVGAEMYGFWITISQSLVFLSALDFGITSSIGRLVAKYKGANEDDNIIKAVNNALILLLIFSLLLILTLPIIIFYLDSIININEYQKPIAIKLILIFGIGLGIDFVLRVGKGLITGFHRFDIVYNTKIAGQIFKLVLILILFKFFESDNLITLGFISMLAIIIPDLIMIFVAFYRVYPRVKLKIKYYSKSIISELLSLGTANVLSNTIATIFMSLTLIAISNLMSFKEVAIYSIPMSILAYPSRFLNTFLLSFTTLSAELQANRNLDKIKKLLFLGIKYSFAVNVGICVGVYYLGYHFLKLWVGANFTIDALSEMSFIFLILCIRYTILKFNDPIDKIFKGIGLHWTVSIINIQMNIVGLLAGYLLMKYFSYGITGMAYGWLISTCVTSFLIYPIFMVKNHLGDIRILIQSITPSIYFIIIPFSLLIYFIPSDYINTWFSLLINSIVVVMLISFIVYNYILAEQHKQIFQFSKFK